MKIIDFTGCKQNERTYGGFAGRKLGIVYEGKNYLLKFPQYLSDSINTTIKYSKAPITEYIGSRIFQSIGIKTHNVILGHYNGIIVAACEDFLKEEERLIEFNKLKITFLPDNERKYDKNGNGHDLNEILYTIRTHPMLKEIKVEEHFWDMFIVDALIGNLDRNNGNWGILKNSLQLAPVYDNGNCLNNKWSEERVLDALKDEEKLFMEVYKKRVSLFTVNKERIYPYTEIIKHTYLGIDTALLRIVPNIDLKKIYQIIEDVNCISDIYKEFYKRVVKIRYEQVLKPAYQGILL